MAENGSYQLNRRKSPSSDIGVVWTGNGWSEDPDDGVLFRRVDAIVAAHPCLKPANELLEKFFEEAS